MQEKALLCLRVYLLVFCGSVMFFLINLGVDDHGCALFLDPLFFKFFKFILDKTINFFHHLLWLGSSCFLKQCRRGLVTHAYASAFPDIQPGNTCAKFEHRASPGITLKLDKLSRLVLGLLIRDIYFLTVLPHALLGRRNYWMMCRAFQAFVLPDNHDFFATLVLGLDDIDWF